MPAEVTAVAGTRPEAIKLAPVVTALRVRGVPTRLVASGQQAGLVDDALRTFGLQADARLGPLEPGQSLASLTARLLARLDVEFAARPPGLVLVQGDTATTLAAALAAFYRRRPCAHVEAGLRTRDPGAPWPEELNRTMVDRLCARLYAPTEAARGNLLGEGLPARDVLVTGQTGVDAAMGVAARLPTVAPGSLAAVLEGARVKLVLASGHRRENLGGGIARVAATLRQVASERDDVTVLFARHPNPDARQELHGIAGHEHWRVVEPLDYAATLWLLRAAACAVSDSGGLQEEAPCFGTPVLVTRDTTERPEGLTAGFLRLVGTDPARLRIALHDVLDDPTLKPRLAALPNPYGDGRAAQRIADDLVAVLGRGPSLIPVGRPGPG